MLGPLARTAEPDVYDLCGEHATRLTAPRGWELLRVEGAGDRPDDLVALAHAVTATAPDAAPDAPTAAGPGARTARTGHRGSGPGTPERPQDPPGADRPEAARHLHVVRSPHA